MSFTQSQQEYKAELALKIHELQQHLKYSEEHRRELIEAARKIERTMEKVLAALYDCYCAIEINHADRQEADKEGMASRDRIYVNMVVKMEKIDQLRPRLSDMKDQAREAGQNSIMIASQLSDALTEYELIESSQDN